MAARSSFVSILLYSILPIIIAGPLLERQVDEPPSSLHSRTLLGGTASTNLTALLANGFLSSSQLSDDFLDYGLTTNLTRPGRQLAELPPGPPTYKLSLTGDDESLAIQYSKCASRMKTRRGSWTFLDNTAGSSTSFSQIWDDAGEHSHDHDGVATGFNYALWKSVANNVASQKPLFDSVASKITCPNDTATLATSDSDGFLIHDELRRRLLQLNERQIYVINTLIPKTTRGLMAIAAMKIIKDQTPNTTMTETLTKSALLLAPIAGLGFVLRDYLVRYFNVANLANLQVAPAAKRDLHERDRQAQSNIVMQDPRALLAAAGLVMNLGMIMTKIDSMLPTLVAPINTANTGRKRQIEASTTCLSIDEMTDALGGVDMVNQPNLNFLPYADAEAELQVEQGQTCSA